MIRYYSKRICIICTLVLIGVILYYSGITSYFTLEKIQHHAGMMLSFVHERYITAVFIYCTFFVCATVLSLPVTIVLTILGGYLFGILLGLLYAVTSATVGSVILFLLVRYLCGGIAQRFFWRQVDRFRYEIKERGYSYVLMLQLLPITPTPLVIIAAGLSPLSTSTFAWATFVGMFPGTLLYTIAGQQLGSIHSINDVFSWPIIIIFVLLALLSLLIPYTLRYMGLKHTVR